MYVLKITYFITKKYIELKRNSNSELYQQCSISSSVKFLFERNLSKQDMMDPEKYK